MTKSQLIDLIAADLDLPRRIVDQAINGMFDAMTDALKREERIEIRGFGNFTIREYGSYTGRNPKTGSKVSVSPKKLPFFKVGKELKELLNR